MENHERIYEGITEINRTLGQIEGKLEGFDERFGRIEALHSRVRSLEGWRKWMNGAQAMVVAGVAWLFK